MESFQIQFLLLRTGYVYGRIDLGMRLLNLYLAWGEMGVFEFVENVSLQLVSRRANIVDMAKVSRKHPETKNAQVSEKSRFRKSL